MRKKTDAERKWVHVDAAGIPLGRVATRVAMLLRGKHRPLFTPHVDSGDFVIVTNASQVVLTGDKAKTKKWYRHAGRPGNLRATSYGDLLANNPVRLVELAVGGMLPKNRLASRLIRKLKVYPGPEHPHSGQTPETVGVSRTASGLPGGIEKAS